MQQTPAKLEEDGISANTLSANSTRKLALYSHLFSIFTTYHLFCQLAFTRISFDCNAPFQASSFPFRS